MAFPRELFEYILLKIRELRKKLRQGQKMQELVHITKESGEAKSGKQLYSRLGWQLILIGTKAWRWELDHKEGWVPKIWCFQIVVLEKTLESPLVCKEIKLVNPKENQSWIFIERTGAEAEAPILWSPDGQSRLIGEDPDARKEKAEVSAEDEMVRQHHWLGWHESEQTPADSKGQGSLVCGLCSRGHKESDTA